MLDGERVVRVHDGLDRMPTGPADRRFRQFAPEGSQATQRQRTSEPVEPVDMGVERLRADAEAGRDLGQGHGIEAALLLEQGHSGIEDLLTIDAHGRSHVVKTDRVRPYEGGP